MLTLLNRKRSCWRSVKSANPGYKLTSSSLAHGSQYSRPEASERQRPRNRSPVGRDRGHEHNRGPGAIFFQATMLATDAGRKRDVDSFIRAFTRTVADPSRSSEPNYPDVVAIAARFSPARGPTRKLQLSSTPAPTLLESTTKTASLLQAPHTIRWSRRPPSDWTVLFATPSLGPRSWREIPGTTRTSKIPGLCWPYNQDLAGLNLHEPHPRPWSLECAS